MAVSDVRELAAMRHAWVIERPVPRLPSRWRPLARRAWLRRWADCDGQVVAACYCGWEQPFDTLAAAQAAVDAHLGRPLCWAGPLPPP